MQKFADVKIWIAGFVVLLFAAGCCTPNQTGVVTPALVTMAPVSEGTSACPTSVVTAAFNEAMNPATVTSATFTLSGPGAAPVAATVSFNKASNTAVLTPSANLVRGSSYTATATTGMTDLYGNHLPSNTVWTFSTAANGCTPPPTVTTVSPLADSTTTCPNSAVAATFNEAMDPTTINGTNFLLTAPGGSSVAGQVTYNSASNTATFTPSSSLAAGAIYSATVTKGAHDTFGNALANNVSWTFTTAANGCHPAPQLVSLTPSAGATATCPNAAVVATFSEAMNASTINTTSFSLSPGVVGTISHDSTSTIFTFTPSSSLALNQKYMATISTGAQDTFGNPLPNSVVSSFTTATNGCHPGPVINAVTPLNAASGACPNKVITANFSEAMTPSTINGSTFVVTGANGAQVAGQVTYDPAANTAIFSPTSSLALNSTYTATITTGAQDTFGNALANNFGWSFATGANSCLPPAPPVSVTPANGASAICSGAVVAATFAQAMNPATLNATTFTVTAPGGAAVAGQITPDAANKVFTFTPTSALSQSTVYTATITTGAQDTFGNALASNFVWTFTTGVTTCGGSTPPSVTTENPLAAATGVCTNQLIAATFTEPMNPTTLNATTFTLSPGVTGTVALDGSGKVATFTPASNLSLNTTYSATITTGAQDLAGNGLASNFVWSFTTSAASCQTLIPLGSAANFEILAGSTVTNTGPTVVTGGNLGLSPGSSVTGFPPGVLTTPAAMHITDEVAAQAELDLAIAYNDAAGLTGAAVLPADVTGQTFTPGLYRNATSVILSGGNMTLDAQGDANAVFIFQIGTTLTTLGNTQIVLAGGAQAKNVFWQVGTSATLGTSSIFDGNIMALQSITLDTGATLNGRALAINAAVTLDSDVVTAP